MQCTGSLKNSGVKVITCNTRKFQKFPRVLRKNKDRRGCVLLAKATAISVKSVIKKMHN